MSSFLISFSLCLGAGVVLWRAVHVVDRMSGCTCRPVAWAWVALGVVALWVGCAAVTGRDLLDALIAFVLAAAAVLATDRRWWGRRRRVRVS